MVSAVTNPGANTALQSLNRTNKSLDQVQQKVNTGLRVSGPKDDPSTFQIAQRLLGDKGGYQADQIALSLGQAVVGTALSAGQGISDLLTEIKGKVVQANQAGLDPESQSALNNDIQALVGQIGTIVGSASFNGQNLIASCASSFSVLSSVDGSTIAVSAASLDASSLGLGGISVIGSSGAAAALASINSAIPTASSRLSSLGSSAQAIQGQAEFNSKYTDILSESIGTQVDADLAVEAANLQALQIKQRLGGQALSIANSRPQSLLGLFGNG